METHSVIWGLDIGHTSLKAVKLQRSGERVSVLGYAIEPIATGEDQDRDDAVVKALQSLAVREEMRGTPVIASLSGRQIFSRTIPVPVLNPKKIGKMVELEARQAIPGNFDEVRWSYHLSPSIDGSANDVALFAARKEIVDDLTQKCRKAGLELVAISVSSLAVYNFIAFDQDFEHDEAVVVLDVGAENTDLVVYQGETLWMRTLGVAGNDITRAFMKKFRVSYEEAETLKCQVADSNQADRILKVVEPSLSELVSDVQRSLGFYKSQNSTANFQNVVVSGNTFRLPGLAQFMADRLGYAIIELVELEKVGVASGLDREHFLEDLQSLGVAMGLGLQGLGLSRANVNLLPTSQVLQTALKQKRWAAVAVLVMILVTFVATYAIDQARMNDNVQIQKEIAAKVEDNEEQKGQAEETARRIKPLARVINDYGDYGAHIGYLHAVEQQVLEVIGRLARDERFRGLDVSANPTQGGDPFQQSVYLRSLEIPPFPYQGRSPFAQHEVQRSVVLKVWIPDYAKRFDLSNALKAALEDLRLADEAYRARHPLLDLLPPDERPRLFAGVELQGGVPEQITYRFVDPSYQDPVSGQIEAREREIPVRGYTTTLECLLGQDTAPSEAPAGRMSMGGGFPGNGMTGPGPGGM